MSNARTRRGNWWLLFLPLLLLLSAALLTSGVASAGLGAGNPSGQAARGTGPALDTPTPICRPDWTVYPNPAPAGESVLKAITAISPTDLWAVGYYTGTDSPHTLIVHGDGTNWTQVPSPDPGSRDVVLRSVSGVATNDVWAVGSYLDGEYSQWSTLTMHWDGTAWVIVPSPNGYWGTNHLYGVVAIAPNDVWAVGESTSGSYHAHPLIEHWNGSSWSVVTGPNSGGLRLNSVDAVSATDVWAVGGGGVSMGFVEHWDGSAWSVVSSPSSSVLYGVTAVSANDVWAVGLRGTIPASETVAEHWDGSTWSIMPSASPGATTNQLYGVSALAANDVWAVGDTDWEGGGTVTLAEHWNGSVWTQVPVPASRTGRDHLYGVAATAGGVVWAVGEQGCTSGCSRNALIMRYGPVCAPTPTPTPCNLAWRTVSSPNQEFRSSYLYAVGVVAANDIWAVGSYFPNNSNSWVHTLTMHWDGTNWTWVPSPSPNIASLFGIAVVATNDIWAVGFVASQTLILHWDGMQWSVVPSPSPGSDTELRGIAAVSANDVWAVGDNSGGTLIVHWDGAQWSTVVNSGTTRLTGIAVVSANDIWAVGDYYNLGVEGGIRTQTMHWDGTQWSVVSSPNGYTLYNTLTGVAAVSANDVWAVGYYQRYGGGYGALILHWDGAQWSIVAGPNPSPGSSNYLYGVTARAANDVWAVGDYYDGSGPRRTLAAHWDGTQWSVVPSPNASLRGVAAVGASDVWAVGSRQENTFVARYHSSCAGATPTATATVTATPTVPPCPPPPGPWRTLTPGPSPGTYRMGAATLGIYGQLIYFYGGGTSTTVGDNRMWRLRAVTGIWEQRANMPTGKQGIQGSFWSNKIYVPGGLTADGYITENAIYDTITNSWTTGAPMPAARAPATAAYSGKIYAFGGDPGPTNDVFIYDIASNTWTTGAPMPAALAYGRAIVLSSYIYYIGGISGTGPSGAIYRYSPIANSWITMPTHLLTPRSGEELITDAVKIYIVGGASGSDPFVAVPRPQSVEIYDPSNGSIVYGSPLVESVSSPGGGGAIFSGINLQLVIYGGVNGTTYSTLTQSAPFQGELCTPTPTVTATPPPSCGLFWRPVPVPALDQAHLNGVAAISANDIWAVGVYHPGNYDQALILHWNGTNWSIVPGPSTPTTSSLGGVAALAANDVWAVGMYRDASDRATTLVEHWDGTSWSIVPSPSPGGFNTLNDVAAISANDVWAVGWQATGGVDTTLIEHWNGTSWSVVSSPNQNYSYLYGVTALAANDVWAVGDSGVDTTLIEHWNGTSWSIVSSPGTGGLRSIAAVAANDIWAVGHTGSTGFYQTLIEHWNGTNWSVVPSPSLGSNSVLNGVAAVAGNDVWAVGEYRDASGGIQTLAEHWNGGSWSAVPSPNGSLNGLAAVAGNDVWAVGSRQNGTLILRYKDPCVGGTATPTGTPQPVCTQPTGTPYPTATPYPTPTTSCCDVCPIRPSNTPYPTSTPYATNTAYPCPGCTTSTPTPTPSPTLTNSPTNSRTPTNTRTATSTPTITPTFACRLETLTPNPTYTRNPTYTPLPPTMTHTACPVPPTYPPNPTYTPNATYTSNPTFTPTNAWTNTPTTTPDNTSTPCPLPFTDVGPDDYFYTAVRYLYCDGVISGYADNTFRPYDNTTRGQLCKIVVLAEGWELYTPPSPTFSDVPADHPFYQYVETAHHEGVISGYGDGTFRPYDNTTRGQLCKIVVLAEGWTMYTPPSPTFGDVPAGHPFYEYIETAYYHGIIGGYADGTFRPGNNATRGQICKIVYMAITAP